MTKPTAAMTKTVNEIRLELIERGFEARPHTHGRLLVTGERGNETDTIRGIATRHSKGVFVSSVFEGTLIKGA